MKSHTLRISLSGAIGIILALAIIVEKANGYVHWHCECNDKNLVWPNNKLNWRAGKQSFKTNVWRLALTTANARWNQAPGDFTFGIRNWGEEYVGRGNGQNEIWFTYDLFTIGLAPAVCSWSYVCGGNKHKIVEADVIFNTWLVLWSTLTTKFDKIPYGGIRRPWGTTALHEFGHALGLAHVNFTYNIMGQDWDHIHANGITARHYVGEYAGHGEVHLYGKTQTTRKNDLGVTHWKYGFADNEYSGHVLCRIYNMDDSQVPREDFNGFKRYKVQKNRDYKVQFTYENNGYYDKSDVHVAFYVSTNSHISTNDTRIRKLTMNLNRNKVYTTKRIVTIPSDLTTEQTYYLGVIVDYPDFITEFCESNNATYLPIRIVRGVPN